MSDGRKNNSGTKGNKGGSPGYGKLEFIKDKVIKHSVSWWKKWESMMKSKDMQDVKFAMTEFNKLQTKMIPQDLTSDGEKIIPLAGFNYVKPRKDNTNSKASSKTG